MYSSASNPSADLSAVPPQSRRVSKEFEEYVGDEAHAALPVAHNLDLYFREQVFSPKRPSFPALYMRLVSNAYVESNVEDLGPADHWCDPNFIPIDSESERFLSVFRENVPTACFRALSPIFPHLLRRTIDVPRSEVGEDGQLVPEPEVVVEGVACAEEATVTIIVTNAFVYIACDFHRALYRSRKGGGGEVGLDFPLTFREAPIPLVFAKQPLNSIR